MEGRCSYSRFFSLALGHVAREFVVWFALAVGGRPGCRSVCGLVSFKSFVCSPKLAFGHSVGYTLLFQMASGYSVGYILLLFSLH